MAGVRGGFGISRSPAKPHIVRGVSGTKATVGPVSLANAEALRQAAEDAADAAEAALAAAELITAPLTAPANAQVASYVTLPGATKDALTATIDQKIPVVVVKPTGTNDQALIDAAVQAGALVVDISAPGVYAWDASPAWFVGVELRCSEQTVIQLAPDVLYGPQWNGGRFVIAMDNPIASATAGTVVLNTNADLRPGGLSAGGIEPGTRIDISSGKRLGSRSYEYTSEFAQVVAITASTITLAAPLRYSYATADTIQIARYVLTVGAKITGNPTILAHPAATVRQTLAYVGRCESPEITARVGGERASVGVDFSECITPIARVLANDIKDLANPTPASYTGYGVRTWACVDADIYVDGKRCRHAFDDAGGNRRPFSLRSRVRGVATDCASAGFSTHGGSDECMFELTKAVNCGGGYIVRGLRARGRGVQVLGTNNFTGDEYTAIGGGPQSYRHGLTIGEVAAGGVAVNLAGNGLDWEFAKLDMTGGDSTSDGIHSEFTDVTNSKFELGEAVLPADVDGFYAKYVDLFEGVQITGSRTIIKRGAGQVVYAAPATPSDTRAAQNVDVDLKDVDGYAAPIVAIYGGNHGATTQPTKVSKGIRLRGSARNRDAGYASSSSLWQFFGWYSTSPGSVDVRGLHHPESSTANAIKTDLANNNAGIGAGLLKSGNLGLTGFDSTPPDGTGPVTGSTGTFTSDVSVTGRVTQTNPATSPARVAGQYYLPPHMGLSAASATLGNGNLRLTPFVVERATTIDKLSASVSGAGVALCTLLLTVYADDNGYPGALVASGSVAADAVADPAVTVAATLQPGIYWIGAALQNYASGTQPSVVTGGAPVVRIPMRLGTTPPAATAIAGFNLAGVTGAAPNPFTAGAPLSGTIPRVAYRAA